MAQVFISYSSEHRDLTEKLAGFLESCGLDVWWDKELHSRRDFDRQIDEELRNAGCVVVLWTAGAVLSKWVHKEAAYARDHDRLVCARADDLPPASIPEDFRKRDAHKFEAERHLILRDVLAVREGRLLLEDKREDLPAHDERTPTMLLQAKFGIVPFTGRQSVRDDLVDWALSRGAYASAARRSAGRLIHGPGGLGKTRLLIEVAETLRSEGWSAGFLARPGAADRAGDTAEIRTARRERQVKALNHFIRGANDNGLLLVMDYAEGREAEIGDLSAAILSRPEGDARRIRLVLLARGAGDWWARLVEDDQATRALFGDGRPDVRALDGIANGIARLGLFHAAVRAFVPKLKEMGYAMPADGEATQRLAERLRRVETNASYKQGEGYDRPLAVAMEALLYLAAMAPNADEPGVHNLLANTLGLERQHWSKLAGDRDPPKELHRKKIERAVAQVTGLQGLGPRRAAEDLFMLDGRYPERRGNRGTVEDLTEFVGKVYGRGGFFFQLEPDLVGEHHVGLVADQELLDGCVEWTAKLPDAQQAVFRRNLLTVLQRASRPEHGVSGVERAAALLDHVVRRHGPDFAVAAAQVMIDTPGELQPRIEALIAELPLATLGALSSAIPRGSLSLASLAAAVESEAVARIRSAAGKDDVGGLARLAEALEKLGERLKDVGLTGQAMAAAREAETICRSGLSRYPEKFYPILTGVLKSISDLAYQSGDLQSALNAAAEGIPLARLLSYADPEGYLLGLSRFLGNFGGVLLKAGAVEDASRVAEESISIASQMGDEADTLAYAHHHLSICLANSGRTEEAAKAAETALTLSETLAASEPDRFLPLLGIVQLSRGNRLFELGQLDSALQSTNGACATFTEINMRHPHACDVELGKTLAARSAVKEKMGAVLDAMKDAEIGLRLVLPHAGAGEVDHNSVDTMTRRYLALCLKAQRAPDHGLAEAVARVQSAPSASVGEEPNRGISVSTLTHLTEMLLTGRVPRKLALALPKKSRSQLDKLAERARKDNAAAVAPSGHADSAAEGQDDRFAAAVKAIRAGDLVAIEALCRAGILLGRADASGSTLLHFAAEAGQPAIAAMLLSEGATVGATASDGATPLHSAAISGSADVAGVLIAAGAAVDVADQHGYTPVERAIESDHVPVLERLLAAGADASCLTSTGGGTPLHMAAYWGRLEASEVLLNHGAALNALAGPAGHSALMTAIDGGNTQFALALIRRGANVHVTSATDRISALHMAAGKGNAKVCAALLDAGASVSAQTADGATPQHYAAAANDAAALRMLVERDGLYNAAGEGAVTPLHVAAQEGRVDAIRILATAGAGLDAPARGETPLLTAARNGQADAVVELLRLGSNPNALTRQGLGLAHVAAVRGHVSVLEILGRSTYRAATAEDGFTPLHLAAQEGHARAIRFLLANGADVNAKSTGGGTALHSAAHQGHETAIATLVAAGAKIDSATEDGKTALVTAIEERRLAAVVALLDRGASPHIADAQGWGPLHHAAYHGLYMVVYGLLARGSVAGMRAAHDVTPIHLASQQGFVGIARLLIGAGADVICKSARGETPLDLAMAAGAVEIARLLSESGAHARARDEKGAEAHQPAKWRGVLSRFGLLQRRGKDPRT